MSFLYLTITSRGWIYRFKSRHGVSKRVYAGEAAGADMKAVVTGREQLKKLLEAYEPDDIFNIDETGLFYMLGPNYILTTKSMSGVKQSKDRLTVALCANAIGTTTIKPFVISKAQRPRCFGSSFNPELYVTYRANKKAWMSYSAFGQRVKPRLRQCQINSCYHSFLAPKHHSTYPTHGCRDNQDFQGTSLKIAREILPAMRRRREVADCEYVPGHTLHKDCLECHDPTDNIELLPTCADFTRSS